MAETFLNGKVTISSLAAPTVEDIAILRALSEDDHRAVIGEALARGRNSPVTDKTIDDAWNEALKVSRTTKKKSNFYEL